MKEYKIRITGEYDILVLSPEMIALLIEKARNSNTKEFVIPAEEILPQGYTEYLTHVLAANIETEPLNADMQEVYKLIAEQIQKLSIDQQKCFDKVSLCKRQYHTQFNLRASETFYMLVKQKTSSFTYVYTDLDEKEIRITLSYQ